MKSTRLLSLVLFALLFALALSSCENGETEETVTPAATHVETGDRPASAPLPAGEVTTALEARLELPASLPNGETVPLGFTLFNRSDEKLYLLKWFTPLDETLSEVFSVRLDGGRLHFRGWLTERGDPTSADYVGIEPGGSVTAEIDLAPAYYFGEAGRYEVELLTPMFTHLARSEGEMARSKGDLTSVPVTANTATTDVAAGMTVKPGQEDASDRSRGKEQCGVCPNPLVSILDVEIEGDFEAIWELMEVFAEYDFDSDLPERTVGWRALITGHFDLGNMTINDWMQRTFEWLCMTSRHPCAGIRRGRLDGDPGNAKYVIRSHISIELTGGMAEILYSKDDLVRPLKVPRVGVITFQHELVALKNNQVYDEGQYIVNWVEPPSPGEDYFQHEVGSFPGYWDPSNLHGAPITFNKGDIGTTIRKKETPSAAQLEVDDTTRYPPYYTLELTDIMNEFDEPLPNNVRVALRVNQGELHGGTKMDGWMVYNTQDGRTQIPVLYEPPKCPEADSAKLEIAEVCDWHDGDPSPGEPRVTKRIPLRQCTNWAGTFTINYKGQSEWADDYGDTSYSGSYNATATFLFVPDESGTLYWAQGSPGGSYSSSSTNLQTFTAPGKGEVGGSSQICDCSGGFQMTGPEAQSSLDIYGDQYDFAIILDSDPDASCDATWEEWDAFGNKTVSHSISHCNYFFIDDCGARGTFSGNTIQGQNTIESEDVRLVCTWDFHRE